MQRISQQQLEFYLWGAATLLRGTIDAGDYKQFIFPLLFYKRLCDVFDEETQSALKESGGDAAFATYPENHRFQIPQDAHWREVRKAAKNVGQALQSAMRAIETANPEKLYGIFGDAQWTNKDRLSDAMLRDLVEHFSTLELTVANLPEDELGQGYEYLIKKFADDSGHTAAEFYTNRTVVHLMTELLDVQPGESVYDPTCGSGGMLLSCISHLRRQGEEWRNVRLFGQERNLMTSSIARMNCFLHGIEDFSIERGDTLSDPKFIHRDQLQRFDIVLANPPYSIKQWDREAFASDPWGRNLYGTPPQGRADYAFQQHILQSLNPKTGRCAVLWPHGILFRNEEEEIRRKFIESDAIEAIIGLGPNLFYNSSMQSCILICRAAKSKTHRQKILFIDAVYEVTRDRAQSFLQPQHIDRIVSAHGGFKDLPGFAKIGTLEEIRKNQYSLNIPLYVQAQSQQLKIQDREVTTLSEATSRWLQTSTLARASLAEMISATLVEAAHSARPMATWKPAWANRTKWERVHLGQVCSEISERIDKPSSSNHKRFVGLEHLDSGALKVQRWGTPESLESAMKTFSAGDTLFARRNAYLKRASLADFDGICSGDAIVLREDPKRVVPGFLPVILNVKQFWDFAIANAAGTMSRRVNGRILMRYAFDLPPLDEQRRIVETLTSLSETQYAYEATLDALSTFSSNAFQHINNSTALPTGWSLVPLQALCSHIVDCLHSTPECVETGYPVIRTADVVPGRMLVEQARRVPQKTYEMRISRLRPEEGDIFYSREGARFGIAAPVPPNVQVCLGQRMMHFRSSAETDAGYLLWLLNSPIVRNQAFAGVIGSASPHVNIKDIKQFTVPRPPLHEQRRIGQLSRSILETEEKIQTHITSIKGLVTGLIEELTV